MAKVRIATFNVENLLQRFDFYRYGSLTVERPLRLLGVSDFDEDMPLRRALHVNLTDDSRQMTAQCIRDTEADVICLQEIDNKEVLDDFHEYYVKKSTGVNYGWRRLLEGNDRRGIDVAIMSKSRIHSVTSHAHHTFDDFNLFNQELDDYGLSPGDGIFRRDCLEADVTVSGARFTLFVCHFKSMSGGRERTIPVRRAEAEAVKRIINDKFGQNAANEKWLIVGDLNDYTHTDGVAVQPNGLEPLLDNGFSVNLVDNIANADERWTHYYSADGTHHQLDYILASPAIANANPGVRPEIIRNGQAYRVPRIENLDRYPRVGFDRPKASDHCPVVVEIDI